MKVLCELGTRFLIIKNLIGDFTVPKIPISIIHTPHSQEVFIYSNSGFLSLYTVDILDWRVLCCGAVLCTVGGLAESLASTHWMPVAHP